MFKLLLILLGGGFGSLMRYWVSGWTQRWANGSFPLGTLSVNIIGCALIGFLNALVLGRLLVREEYRVGLIVGVLGGFTTFSSYSWESVALANNGQLWLALTNVVVSNVVCLFLAFAGYRLGIWCFGVA
jgi:fluoride exporter